MDRLSNIDDTQFQAVRANLAATGPYIGKSEPLPGTALKLDDDVLWLGVIPLRACWGYETPDYFFGYNPDIDTDGCSYYEGIYITDRAPADSNETPMPIYPQQQQQRQAKKPLDEREVLQALLKRITPKQAKHVRALVKEKRPELLKGHG